VAQTPHHSPKVSTPDGMLVEKSEAGSFDSVFGASEEDPDEMLVEALTPQPSAPAPAPAPAPSAELHPYFVPLLHLAGPLLEFQLSLASSPSDKARTRMKVVIDMLAELVLRSGEGEGGGN
jgi:hypothetical protein